MEETLNKTDNKIVDFSNIRDVQNLLKNKSISNFASNVKSFKQRVSSLSDKIADVKKNYEAQKAKLAEQKTVEQKVVEPKVSEVKVSEPVVSNAQKAAVTSAPKVEAPAKQTQTVKETPVKSQNEKPAQQNFNRQDRNQDRNNNYNNNRNNGGYNNNQRQNYNGQNGQNNRFGQRNDNNNRGGYNNNNYQNRNGQQGGGRFTPTGERRFDNNGDRRQGGFNNNNQGQYNRNGQGNRQNNGNSNFQRKPFGQNQGAGTGSFVPRLAKPTESISASTLIQKNTRGNQQKKKYEKTGEERKSTMSKKALMMRDYVNENGIDESEQKEQVTIKKHNKKAKEVAPVKVVQKIEHAVITTDNLTVKILAETIGKSVPELMKKFIGQ